MIDRTHPDLDVIIVRTIKYQFCVPSVLILGTTVLKLSGYLHTIPWFLLPLVLFIAYSVGLAMIAVYNLVNLFTKLAQRKSN